MSNNATLDQLRSHRTSVTQALLDQHTRKGLTVQSSTPFREARPAPPSFATGAQCGYLADLLTRLDGHDAATAAAARAWIADKGGIVALDRTDASRAIDAAKRHLAIPAVAPRPTSASSVYAEIRSALENVPSDRYYAVEAGPRDSGDWRFYRVTNGSRVQVGRADGCGLAWDRLSPDRQLAAARAIAGDPHEAMLNFGRKIGKCGHCGRVLTNQASREAGIGPVCAGK
jgi:hypothetical protein